MSREPTEMERRVTRALLDAAMGGPPGVIDCGHMAREAIRAMREPTVEMVKSARPYPDWRSMIDAASPPFTDAP